MKYIKTYADNAAYEADKSNMSAPHVGYIQATEEVKYINDMADLYDIYGTVTTDNANYPYINFNVGGNNPVTYLGGGKFGFASTITQSFKTIQFIDNVGVSGGMNKFRTIDKIGYDLSNFTSISFNGCQSLTSINLNGVDTSSVTSMSGMFINCQQLASLDLSNFNTSASTSMKNMFANCKSLTSLDLSNFNTSGVTTMEAMFFGASGLTSLDVSNFDTSKVTNMTSMFRECKSLASLDLSNFNTSGATTMANMFLNCNSLTSLDLSNFNTSSVTNMSNMFQGCTKMASLNISNWDMTNANTNFFFSTFGDSVSTITITMNNTNSTTFDKIKSALGDGTAARNKTTIIRDGHSYQYQNGQWVEV